MKSGFMNKLIIWLARKIGCSPLVAHIIILMLVTIAFGFMNPDGFGFFDKTYNASIWFSFCALVVFITWATKGPYLKAWLSAKEWDEAP